MLRAIFILCLLLLAMPAQAACTQTSATEQTCTYTLAWDWAQGTGGPALGFVVQQQVDNNDEWYDIYNPLPLSQKSLVDAIVGDKGGRVIAWRVLAYNDIGRSGPSNTVSVTTPAIVAPAESVVIKTRPGLTVNVSRRGTDSSSIISVLLNKNETLGPEGVEIAYPAGSTLNVSRRAGNTTSIVSVLVNKSVVVTVNGQAR